jgi:hypothetical protein
MLEEYKWKGYYCEQYHTNIVKRQCTDIVGSNFNSILRVHFIRSQQDPPHMAIYNCPMCLDKNTREIGLFSCLSLIISHMHAIPVPLPKFRNESSNQNCKLRAFCLFFNSYQSG